MQPQRTQFRRCGQFAELRMAIDDCKGCIVWHLCEALCKLCTPLRQLRLIRQKDLLRPPADKKKGVWGKLQ